MRLHPRLRLGLMLLPVFLLAGCGPYSCFDSSVEQGGSGTVTFVNPPSSVTPGSTLKLDLTGSTLPGHCVYSVSSLLEGDAAWAGRWRDTAQESALYKPTKACETFHGTIDVPIPETFTGGTLTVRISSKADSAALLYTVGTRYTAQADLKLAVAAPATPKAPTARVFPRYLRMDPVLASLRTIDARASSDPQGQALTYTWDTNNDGVYGDPVEETGTNGVVRIPAATLTGFGSPGTSFTFGVKATNASGLSSTATAKAETIGTQPDTTQTLEFSPATGVVGSPTTVTFTPTSNITLACFDTNGDGMYTDAQATAAPWSATFTPTVAGTQQVGVILETGTNSTCALINAQFASGIFPFQQGVADAYTSAAARSARATATGYRAKARFSLGGATMVALGDVDAYGTFTGTTGRGTYTLSTPAKGNGSARPQALTLFPKGDYVVRAASLGFFGATRNQTVIGQSTMLLRGTGGALLCLAVTGTPSGSTYVFRGGTGAAAKLTGDASSTRFQVRAKSPKPPRSGKVSFKGKKQKGAIRSNATIAAATAKATPLPADCSALRRYLP